MTKTLDYRLVVFGASSPPPTCDVARLHGVLLPESPVALLGERFMKGFYYATLPREGLIFGTVAYVDNEPAGFVVATDAPDSFMRYALRRWWLHIIWLVGSSMFLKPKSIGTVYELLRVMRNQSSRPPAEPEGEILSLGVLTPYRDAPFIRKSGLRLSNDLLESAVAQLSERGVRAIRATVSAANNPAKLFYSSLGWKLNRSSASGWRHATVRFVWRA